MACGDRYKHLIVTAASGYTPEDPYGLVATPSDYEEWVTLVDKLAAQAMTRLKRLGTVECKAIGAAGCAVYSLPGALAPANPKMVRYNEVQTLVNQMNQQIEDLPRIFIAVAYDIPKVIGQAIDACFAAVCAMDEADRAVAQYGGNVIEVPGGRDTDGSLWWLWAAGGGALVLGSIWLGKKYIRGRREKSAPSAGRRAQPRLAGTGEDSGLGARMAEGALAQSRSAVR